jgi:hypothetical protein
MTSFKHLKKENFKDHPSIATKLVKFLAISTSFKAIKKLTIKAVHLESKIFDFKKQLRVLVKYVASASNTSCQA